MKDKHLFVNNVREFESKHGGNVFEIDLIDLDTTEQYHTYADPNNFNYKHWREITEHPDNGFIVTNCRLKKGKQIDADSAVEIEMNLSGQDAIRQIHDHINEQKAKRMPVSQMGLFEW